MTPSAKALVDRVTGSVGAGNEAARSHWLREQLARLPDGARILDAGAGQLRNKPLCSHLRYVSQDFNQYEGKGDGAALQTGTWDTSAIDIVSDITAIPQPDESFDAVLCSEVLEHVPDPIAAVAELARLLKPRGRLILTAPMCSLTHFAPFHYSSGFNRYWYEHHLQRLGLDMEEISANGDFIEYLAQEIRRLPWFSTQYAGRRLGLFDKALWLLALLRLKTLRKAARASSNLVCFGFNVVASKRGLTP